jgi:hypothetical protein
MIKKISILLLLAITTNSCMEKKYEWSASISAPREYPVEVYTGAAGGYFFSQMGGFSNTGWGGGVGDNNIEATLPDNLDMTWLSYVDDKFYTGEWKLPTEKIKKLFDEGFHSRPGSESKIDNYSIVKIGLAPKGMVVVWVMGAGHQVEVARFQAHETTIDPKLITEDEMYMFRKGYAKRALTYDGTISPELRQDLQQYGYPSPEAYEAYQIEKYNWKPKIILPEGSKISSIYIKMCNGEMEDPYDLPIDQKNRAIPFSFQIFWSIASGKKEQKYVSRIAFTQDKEYWAKYLEGGENEMPVDFEKNKIRKLFRDNIDKNKPVEMVIKIDPNVETKSERVTDLYLEQDGKRYDIKEKVTRTGKYD